MYVLIGKGKSTTKKLITMCKSEIFAENKVIMAEENKYNHDSVNELLTWAKDVLDSKKYPSGEFQLDKCAKILDCGKFLDSMISVISRNWENPTFHPSIDQLRLFKEKIGKAAE